MPNRLKLLIPASLLTALLFVEIAQAVPPPDFIFAAGAQIAQIFAIVFLFLSAAFSMFYNYIKAKVILIKKHKPSFITLSVLLVVAISITAAYGYNSYSQNKAYQEWVEASEEYDQLAEERVKYLVPTDETTISDLELGSTPTSEDVNSNEEFISAVDSEDPQALFIQEYYEAIATGELDYAYELSKQSVIADVFRGWYSNTTKITLDNLTVIDEETSSVELTLYEDLEYTRYGVLITLRYEEETPVQIATSTVRILSEGTLEEKGYTLVAQASEEEAGFYEENEASEISISNEDFQELINSDREDYVVLDAREDLEHENGSFPGSTHIRYADLQAGMWIDLPEDKYVYVLCWSGIRGQEVAEFLRTKDIVASYLAGGASSWVEFGGKWDGNIKFGEKYTEDRYKITYSTDDVRSYVEDGVVLVDCREPWVYEEWHIEGSVNIPIMYTPSIDLEEAFAQVPAGSTVITVCDDYVNCFDAKITGVELEDRGITFIGRYNFPWEY